MSYNPIGQSPKNGLEEVGRELGEWRKSHQAPTPIPPQIWTRAVELSRVLGVGVVARRLRLDYGALKRRSSESNPGHFQVPSADSKANFLELLSLPASDLEGCIIHIQSERVQARVELSRVSAQSVGALLKEVLKG